MNKVLILNTVKDLVANFLWYDRKEDEELGRGEIEKAIDSGIITVDEITSIFRQELIDSLLENSLHNGS